MWFSGPVVQAVTQAKSKKVVFLVFVEGDDDASKHMCRTWEDKDVVYICRQEHFVCLKLRFGSEAFKQFAAIYPVTATPMCFFIGINGKPIDILLGECSASELISRISKVVEIHDSESSVAGPSLSGRSSAVADKPVVEKLNKAQELIAKRRQEKAKQQEEDERQRELKRREEGRAVQSLKEKQRDQEICEAAEERRKAKREDKAALLRIKEQIAQDRAEKAARFEKQQTEETIQKEERRKQTELDALAKEKAVALSKMSVARIQFRIPDSPPIFQQFDADAQFEEVLRFIAQVNFVFPEVAFTEFSLIQMYPRREFAAADYQKTLRDLELIPSAVLLVLPDARRYPSTKPSESWFSLQSATRLLLWPVRLVYGLFLSLFGGGTTKAIATAETGNDPDSNQQRTQTSGSKIVRMTDRRADKQANADDDPATWNGNSTQQL